MNPVYRIVYNKLVSLFYLLVFVFFFPRFNFVYWEIFLAFTQVCRMCIMYVVAVGKFFCVLQTISILFIIIFMVCITFSEYVVSFSKGNLLMRNSKLSLCLRKNIVLSYEEWLRFFCYFDCNFKLKSVHSFFIKYIYKSNYYVYLLQVTYSRRVNILSHSRNGSQQKQCIVTSTTRKDWLILLFFSKTYVLSIDEKSELLISHLGWMTQSVSGIATVFNCNNGICMMGTVSRLAIITD